MKNVVEIAKKVLLDESEAIKSLISTIDHHFEKIVEVILGSEGKIVVSGIGKSAIIGQKLVATFNSTGQKAVFLHATDALHGDLGIIDSKDIILFISKSGNTPELQILVPLIKRLGNILIALVSDVQSYLAVQSDHILNAHVEKEACPLNLAPTNSTTAALAIGDALAISLLESRQFTKTDFAQFHPGGALGKKLYLRVSDLLTLHQVPKVLDTETIPNTIMEMSAKRLGATAVVNSENKLIGVITDGDLRRMLNQNISIHDLRATDIMNVAPICIDPEEYAMNALLKMKEKSISQLIVSKEGKLLGFIHIHDLIREGLG